MLPIVNTTAKTFDPYYLQFTILPGDAIRLWHGLVWYVVWYADSMTDFAVLGSPWLWP